MKRSFAAKFGAGVIAFGLIGAACSSGDTEPSSSSAENTEGVMAEEDKMDSGASSKPTVDSQAATLTRDLTSLLAGHEYNAGIALYTAVQAKGDLEDPTVQAAVAALDDNSVALSEAIGSVYGDEGAKQFLSLWRAHIGFFVDYTLGTATGDKAMAEEAQKKLDGYRNDFGAFIEGATEGGLTQEQVADALTPHVESTIAAIDSIVAGDGKAFDLLNEAASHLPGIATALSGAISEQNDLTGSADDPAAQLQRDLTNLLAGHEYNAGIALYTAVQAKGDLEDPTVQAAVAALDDNSVALSEAIGSVYGDEGAKQFLSLWRAHIGFFVDYTLAEATGDKAAAADAKKKLDGYRNDFGAFIEGATEGGLTQEQVADALTPHVESTIAAIDSIVAGDGKAFDLLNEAASHLPGIATALSGAIVSQFPDKF